MRKRKRGKGSGRSSEWWMRFYNPAEKVLKLVDFFRSPVGKEKEQQMFRELYISGNYLQQGRREQIKQIAIAITFLLCVVILALMTEAKSIVSQVVMEENRIYRKEDSAQLELVWETEEEAGTVSLSLTPQRVLGEEREQLFQEAESYIRKCIIGTNESLAALYGDLKFPESVPGTEVKVFCRPGSYRWLNFDGSRTARQLPMEGAKETLSVTMSYYEEEREFTLELLLLPQEVAGDLFRSKIESEIAFRAADNSGEYIHLPDAIDGVEVEWSVKRERKGIVLLLLGLIAAVCIPVSGKRRQEDLLQKRAQELMEDYPELVSKYLLLLNAGLSQRSVWERITADYRRSGRKRYAYEEMILTMHEMENGISEAKAYERFGKRCRLLPYMRFSGVLVQNLQKGAKGALVLLEQEALAAFAERKEAAKKRGEEAGTKLLLPMFGLLGIVLVIVMAPALWNL